MLALNQYAFAPKTGSDLTSSLRSRGIQRLLHFTLVDNLASIIKYGLLGRTELEQRQLNYIYTDNKRLDGNPNAICLSITSPNYKMFFSKRNSFSQLGYQDSDWVVILLKPEVLLNLPAAFTFTNAADSRCRGQWQRHSSREAFEAMFYDEALRATLGLNPKQPTNPQAEIQVMRSIPSDWIAAIVCHPNADIRKLQSVAGNLPVLPIYEAFAPRHDYSYWSVNYN